MTFLLAWLASCVAAAFILCGIIRNADARQDRADEHADALGIGGGAFFHDNLNSRMEIDDHA